MNDFKAWGSIFADLPQDDNLSHERIYGFRYFTINSVSVKFVDVEKMTVNGIEIDVSGADTPFSITTQPTLQSLTTSFVWRPGWNKAECRNMYKSKVRLPHKSCGCGLYACTDIAQLTRVAGRGNQTTVLCGVEARGKIVICKRGWRAEQARIVAICTKLPGRIIKDRKGNVIAVQSRYSDIDPETVNSVAAHYGLNVVSLQHIEDEMRRHSM